tara:strand:- start:62 stop:1264 length:1203 start_codon:yes stop_codon:yes gene_type:complete
MLYAPFSTHVGAHLHNLLSYYYHGQLDWYFTPEIRNLNFNKFDNFDVVAIHHSLRYDPKRHFLLKSRLNQFSGKKILFLQDEYLYTGRNIEFIQDVNFDLVYSCVPKQHIKKIYGNSLTTKRRFISILTGYVKDWELNQKFIKPTKSRKIDLGYRGREPEYSWGSLVREKFIFPKKILKEIHKSQIKTDISFRDKDRIYGKKWIDFNQECKAMLGTESGSNLFDFNNDLIETEEKLKLKNPNLTFEEYLIVLKSMGYYEYEKLMNQISPRIFEAIENKTLLVLMEGEYSGVINPKKHYFSLKKDLSNLNEMIKLLKDNNKIQKIVDRAYKDIISSKKYGYKAYVNKIEKEISSLNFTGEIKNDRSIFFITSKKPKKNFILFYLIKIWLILPKNLRKFFPR